VLSKSLLYSMVFHKCVKFLPQMPRS
jgi:hypothetical protein